MGRGDTTAKLSTEPERHAHVGGEWWTRTSMWIRPMRNSSLEGPFNPEWLQDDELDPLLKDEPYEPGFFARLTARRPLVILLVIAFLLLILAPWLYYLLNPPHPRPPRQVPGRVITVLNEKGPLQRTRGRLPLRPVPRADACPPRVWRRVVDRSAL